MLRRRAMMFSKKKLPSEYQEVEYIESNGTQWIDTGIKPMTMTDIDFTEMKFKATDAIINKFSGMYDGSDVWSLSMFPQGNQTYVSSCHGWWVLDNASTDVNTVSFDYTTNTWASSILGTYTDAKFARPYFGSKNVILCGWNEIGDITTGRGRIYYWYAKKADETYKFYFIPCYRKSDNEIGMYEIVSNTFFTNAGTGTFIKGADVN